MRLRTVRPTANRSRVCALLAIDARHHRRWIRLFKRLARAGSGLGSVLQCSSVKLVAAGSPPSQPRGSSTVLSRVFFCYSQKINRV